MTYIIKSKKCRIAFAIVFLILLIGVAIILPMNKRTDAAALPNCPNCGTNENVYVSDGLYKCSECGHTWGSPSECDHTKLYFPLSDGASHQLKCIKCQYVFGTYPCENNGSGKCKDCGRDMSTSAHQHTLTDIVEIDSTYHGRKCTGCNFVTDRSAHDKLGAVQKYTNGHRFYCSICGYLGEYESHTMVAGECTACGYEDPNYCDHSNLGPYQPLDANFHQRSCQDCDNYTEPREPHVWSYSQYDATKHTKTCSRCSYSTQEIHSWNGSTCENCGMPKEVQTQCAHDGDVYYQQVNDTEHSKYCSKCHEVLVNAEAHDWEYTQGSSGYHTKTCKKCDYSTTESCSFKNGSCEHCKALQPQVTCDHNYQKQSDASRHWDECTKCHDKKNYTAHTWGSDGRCTGCQRECAHQWGNYTSISEEKHERSCNICGLKELAQNHTWTEQNRQDARCGVPGSVTKICSACQKTKTETIPALNHNFAPATCTEPQTCRLCGTTQGIALGHNPGSDWKSDDNSHWRECTRCGTHLETGAHNMQEQGRVNAKCGVAGSVTYKCSTCQKTKTDTIPALDHDYQMQHDQTHHWEECTKCGDKKPKEEHTYVNGTCSKCGAEEASTQCSHTYEQKYNDTQHWRQCTKCGNRIEEENHTYETKHNATQHWKECTKCGYQTAKDSHNYGESGTCPDCGEQCVHEYRMKHDNAQHWDECTKCGNKKNQENHTYEKRHNQTQHWEECTKCGYIQNEEAHNYGDDGTCPDCGANKDSEQCEHTYEKRHNDVQHWDECTKCGDRKNVEDHAYEKRNNDTQHWDECPECGNKKNIEDHTFDKKYDDNKHWEECPDCGYKQNEEEHNYGDDGTCPDCGAKKDPEQCEHNYEKKHNDTQHWDECTECGDKKNVENHTFENGKCTECGAPEGAKDCEHDYKKKHNDTQHWEECTKCGDIQNVEKHNFQNGKCTECGAKDNTGASGKLPQTGETIVFVMGSVASIGVGTGAFAKLKKLKDIR